MITDISNDDDGVTEFAEKIMKDNIDTLFSLCILGTRKKIIEKPSGMKMLRKLCVDHIPFMLDRCLLIEAHF